MGAMQRSSWVERRKPGRPLSWRPKEELVGEKGCGPTDPLTSSRGEAEEGLRFAAWRAWAKRAAFRINGRRLPTGVDEGRSEWAQGN